MEISGGMGVARRLCLIAGTTTNSNSVYPGPAARQRNLIARCGGRADLDTGLPGVAYGKAFVSSLREHGVSGAGILRPLIDDLNARAAMSPFDKATAARVACNAQDTPD
jgi:hypothetical protein